MKNSTDITIILDRSGSMENIKSDVIGGLNAFIEEQQKVEGECTLTVVQFDSQNPFEKVIDCQPIADVPTITAEQFVPRGGTPLYDAMGRGINETGQRLAKIAEEDRPDKVVFVTMTDGLENSSREFSRYQVRKMVEEQESKYAWHFVYLGANQDALKAGGDIGVKGQRAADFSPTSTGISNAYAATASNVAGLRSGSRSDLDYSHKQRASMKS